MTTKWVNAHRPGYFGRRRDEKVDMLNRQYGPYNWRLIHIAERFEDGMPASYGFADACKIFYEASYHAYLKERPDDLDFICSFGECYDNALTNVQSGLDYTRQEAFSTHIQDIAVRNVLFRLGRKFHGPPHRLLQIRGPESEGWRFNPGQVPFIYPTLITQPSLRPAWAKEGSVEDFWQSNKWLQVREA